MNTFDPSAPLWDFSQAGDYSTLGQLGDEQFLDLLQKQFAQDFPASPVAVHPDAAVDPSKLTSLPQPVPPPPLSADSSPSPSSANEGPSASRRQSASFDPADESQKRKASDEDPEDSPDHKSAKKGSIRRKSASHQDEGRLLKRKEQNRAAQRAFRERKERHVRDLEDKVAQLEAKNEASQTENTQLRELLKRLQDENVVLKQTQFTFSVPKPSSASTSSDAPSFARNPSTSFAASNTGSAFAAPIATGGSSSSPQSAGGATPQSSSLDTPSSAFPSDIDFGQLTAFDQTQLNLLDENGDTTMTYDFGYGQVVPSNTPYKTIASNTMFMSFAEPTPPADLNPGVSNKPTNGGSYDMNGWVSAANAQRRDDGVRQGSFDELFGGHMFGTQSPMSPASFTSLMNASASATISPVLHATRSPSNISRISSASSPSSNTAHAGASQHMEGTGDCPKTKSEFEQMVNNSGASMFAPPATPTSAGSTTTPTASESITSGPGAMPALHKALSGDGQSPMIMCKGATFPPTEQRDDNVEVLTAWRSITQHPHFKASNIDINDLCAEFTDKARCDGTKIVLNQSGVNYILSRLTQKYVAAQQSNQQGGGQAAAAAQAQTAV